MNQRNVPGIDNAYLAMDTEEGVEVVWNEVMFSERKNFKLQEVGTVRGQSDLCYIHKLLKSPCASYCVDFINFLCVRFNIFFLNQSTMTGLGHFFILMCVFFS